MIVIYELLWSRVVAVTDSVKLLLHHLLGETKDGYKQHFSGCRALVFHLTKTVGSSLVMSYS